MTTKPLSEFHPKVAPDASDTVTDHPDPGHHPEDERLDRLAEIHTRVLDTINGFEKLIDKAEPDFIPVAKAFHDMHTRHERDLAEYLLKAGRDPEQDGSFFGSVNKAVIEMRSWFSDIDHNVMDQVKEGEKHVLEAYQEARDSAQTVEANSMLMRHTEEIDRLMTINAP